MVSGQIRSISGEVKVNSEEIKVISRDFGVISGYNGVIVIFLEFQQYILHNKITNYHVKCRVQH